MKEVILNIDVWLSSDGGVFTKPPEGEGFVHIPAGERVKHTSGSFVRRIKDLNIIFGPADLPPVEKGEEWTWKGFIEHGQAFRK